MLAAFVFAWLAPADEAREAAVQACGEVIGYLNGRAIHAAVLYRGRRYSFARVVPDCERHAAGPGELLVPPGLLYISGPESAP